MVVEGEVAEETGFVFDLKVLRDLVEQAAIDDLDHRNLNLDVPWLSGVNPTTENLVVGLWERMRRLCRRASELERLILWETPRNWVEYSGE